MDFLQQHHCKIDLGQNVLEMGDGEKIHATMRGRKKIGCYNVSRVALEKKAKIPPSSIKICQAKMNNPADVPFLLEGEIHDDVYVLPLLIRGSDFVNVCVMNLSDVPVCLRRHTLLSKAVEVDAMLDPHGKESGDGAQGRVVYVHGDDFDGHIDAELPSICHVGSTENGPGVQFFSAESQDGSLDTSVDVKVGPSRDSVSSDGSSLEGTCSHVRAGLPTQKGAEGCSSVPAEANDTQTRRLPAHLQSVYDDAATRLSEEQAARLHELLLVFVDIFAAHDLNIGEFTALVHWIKTGMVFPILQRMRWTPLGFEGEEKKHLKAMLAARVIEPSVSEWPSPPMLVRKHDKSWRYCIDLRALNSVTERDAYPLPLTEECIDSLDSMRWFCMLDMNLGYWQISIAEEDKIKQLSSRVMACFTSCGCHLGCQMHQRPSIVRCTWSWQDEFGSLSSSTWTTSMWWARRSTRHCQTSRSCSSDSGNLAWSWNPESVHCSALKSSSSGEKLLPTVFMWRQITSRQFWIGQNQRIGRSWRVFLVSWTTTESTCVVWQRSRQFCINWQEPTRSGFGESSIQKPSSFWKMLWQNFPFWVSQLTWPVYPGYWCVGCCNQSWVESGSGGQGVNHRFR